jgi:hypothetical protein
MRYLLILIGVLVLSCSLQAQVGLQFNFNVDRQPAWGPTGYDHVEYYYFPAIEAYYNVPQQRFIYKQGRRWVVAAHLPPRYSGFDVYHAYKVVVNEPRPYRNHRDYRDRYASYRDRHDQQVIRDSRDAKYFVSREHPEHDAWERRQRDNDADRDDYRNDRDRNGREDRSGNGSWGNIGDQPAWGPTGFDRVEYYYFPDVNCYYSVTDHQYVYWGGSEWRHAASLPSSYGNFDPYRSYKVTLNEESPFNNNASHRARYESLRGSRVQPMIRDSRDEKYFVSKDHPEHDAWMRRRDANDDRGRDGRAEADRTGERRQEDRNDRPEGVGRTLGENIDDQPAWGPTGYDRAEYYYIPDINSYYSVSEHQYIFWGGAEWKHAASLPSSYGNYDPYRSYKVVLNENTPFENNANHRAQYASFKGSRVQPMIRDSRESKYFANKDHPQHQNWLRDHQQ